MNHECGIKICDFGLARSIQDHEKFISEQLHIIEEETDTENKKKNILLQSMNTFKMSKKLTRNVTARYYRSPEILLGQTDYTHTSDIWSVGCVLAELLAFSKGKKEGEDILPLFVTLEVPDLTH